MLRLGYGRRISIFAVGDAWRFASSLSEVIETKVMASLGGIV